MNLKLKIQEHRSDWNDEEDSQDSEESSSSDSDRRKGPPIRGQRKPKVPYSIIRREWREMIESGQRPNKSALARKLGISVAVVRGVLNGCEPYRTRENRLISGFKKLGLILGFE